MKAAELRAIIFKENLPVVYEEIEPLLMAELEKLREALTALPERSHPDSILPLFERCVNALNDIDSRPDLDSGIDTEEREGLCKALYTMGEIVGLDSSTQYIDNWRDW